MTDAKPESSGASQAGEWDALQRAILRIAHGGTSRCGAGYGKYPLGVREALRELEPLITRPEVREAIKQFDERLAR